MDNSCYLRNCTQLTAQHASVKNKCRVPDTVKEDIDGCKWNMTPAVHCVGNRLLTNVIGLTALPGAGDDGLHTGM